MKLVFDKKELDSTGGYGLEVAVEGFKGDSGIEPIQLFLEYYEGKLALHVWTVAAENPQTIVFTPVGG